MVRRHKRDTEFYRTLANYKARMQSFNATTMKLREYVRVMLELDTGPRRSTSHIRETVIQRLEREIHAIRRLR
jgi:D-serine deaminase-like pyridoxal phosphate-dependent protein